MLDFLMGAHVVHKVLVCYRDFFLYFLRDIFNYEC